VSPQVSLESTLNIPWVDRLSPWVSSRCPLSVLRASSECPPSVLRVSPQILPSVPRWSLDCPLTVPLVSPIWSNVYQIFKHSSKHNNIFTQMTSVEKQQHDILFPKLRKKNVLMIETNNNLFEYGSFSTNLKKQTNLQENIFFWRTLWTDRELESGNDSCQGHVANHIFSQAKKRRYVAVLSLDPTQCKNL
jgi:hypothetical protein